MKIGRYIVGLLSGLTFGMLFAPKKGRRLRDEIVRKSGSSGQDALNVLFEAFKDAGTDAASEMRKLSENEQLQAALNMSKERMREYLAQLEDSGYDIAAKAQERVEDFSDMAADVTSDFKQRAVRKRKAATTKVKRRVKKATNAVKKTKAAKVAKTVKTVAKATKKTTKPKKRKSTSKAAKKTAKASPKKTTAKKKSTKRRPSSKKK